ncbi:uncharacterized protein PV06_05403 [Exophiala oligosperma]|uniref:Uncharacterized protein n=1 Tax=Exophiala oligosperma TaxID=215243 RepID=A0A0D2C3P3_9EURO|nr:uncharacterized protein PV06_05403 [Exophiala oligosperma]KIW44392.1 hypothetical protein PV06_05403 [Exophiala oligosperma]
MTSQTSERDSAGLDAVRVTPSTAGGRLMPTGPVPVDVNNLNATWTRLQFVNQQYAGFQRESCDIQRTLWTNIHTLLGQKIALEKSWRDINTAYNSKADELTEMAQNSVAEESKGRNRHLAEQQRFLQHDVDQARQRIHALENGVAVHGSTTGAADHAKGAAIHELDSSENGMTTVRTLELQARIKEMEQDYEHMVGRYKDELSGLEARLSVADQKLKQFEQTTDRTRTMDLVISPAVKREPLSSGIDENVKMEDNEITGRGRRRQPKRARKGRKLEPQNPDMRMALVEYIYKDRRRKPSLSQQVESSKGQHNLHAIMNMPRPRNIHSPSQPNQPPVPSPMDALIDNNQGSSVALEASRSRLEASKRAIRPTPLQRIEQLTGEKTALQKELAKCQRQESANRAFKEEMRMVLDRLQQAVFEWRRAQREIDADFNVSLQQGVDTASIKVSIQSRDV